MTAMIAPAFLLLVAPIHINFKQAKARLQSGGTNIHRIATANDAYQKPGLANARPGFLLAIASATWLNYSLKRLRFEKNPEFKGH